MTDILVVLVLLVGILFILLNSPLNKQVKKAISSFFGPLFDIWNRVTGTDSRTRGIAAGMERAAQIAESGVFMSDYPHDPETCSRIAKSIREEIGSSETQ